MIFETKPRKINRLAWVMVWICLWVFSPFILSAQPQEVKYNDGFNSYSRKIKLIPEIWHAAKKNELGNLDADFNQAAGMMVRIEEVGDWIPTDPDPLPVIKSSWISIDNSFSLATSSSVYELKRNSFRFKKSESIDYSKAFDIHVKIGYGDKNKSAPSNYLKITFHHQPTQIAPEQEAEAIASNSSSSTKTSTSNPTSSKHPKTGRQNTPPPDRKNNKQNTGSKESAKASSSQSSREGTINNTVDSTDIGDSALADGTGPVSPLGDGEQGEDEEASSQTTFSITKWIEENLGIGVAILAAIAILGFLLFRMFKSGKSSTSPSESISDSSTQAEHVPFKVKIKSKTGNQKVETSHIARTSFENLPHEPGTLTFDLKTFWEHTQVTRVYMPTAPVEAINAFVQEKNIQTFTEHESQVPEIAGFLLGRYHQQATNDPYEVVIDEFVPITPGEQSVYKVEFGTNAWMELDKVQEKFPDLAVIGWFHTHPGHGLFLSQPDLNIHKGFFRKPWQLAMEIDSLKEGLDMAFFTWKDDKNMNNSSNRLSQQWFSWREIMTQIHKS